MATVSKIARVLREFRLRFRKASWKNIIRLLNSLRRAEQPVAKMKLTFAIAQDHRVMARNNKGGVALLIGLQE